MISHDRSRVLTFTATLLALQFAAGIASAEGSFFKDRRDAVVTQTKPVPPPAPAPTPAPTPVPPHPTDEEIALATGEGRSEPPFAGQNRPNLAPAPTPAPQPQPQPQTQTQPQIQTQTQRQPQSQSQPQPQPQPQSQSQSPTGSADVSGAVSEVLTTDTLVVGGRRIQLAGVHGNSEMRSALQGWIARNGSALNCQPAGARYRCTTSNNKDVGQVVLQNGAGQADTDASTEYRAAEMQARVARRGMWAQR